MPRNAATGVSTLLTNSWNPAVTDTNISSADWNLQALDILAQISTAPATTRALNPTAGQVQDGAFMWGGTAGGTADARTIAMTPPITAYVTGQVFSFINGAANNTTTTPTLNVNGLGARTIVNQAGGALAAGQLLLSTNFIVQFDGVNFRLLPALPAAPVLITRQARTSNTALAGSDGGTYIDVTSGTFTQTFSAASGLGVGWFCYYRNIGTGDVTLDPNGAELIDGLASYVMYPSEARLIICDGSSFHSTVLAPFNRRFTDSGTFTTPPGYSLFSGLLWSGGSGGPYGAQSAGAGGGGCMPFTSPSSLLGASISITIGAGGVARTTGGLATIGGTSTLGGLLTCAGASGGNGGGWPSTPPSVFSSGGAPTSNSFYAGAGGSSTTTNPFLAGSSAFGGGGGGLWDTTNSALRAPGTSIFGGAGGAGSNSGSGVAGGIPSGGGGGTNTGTTSGAGGRGQLDIWGVA